jgi:hypothetical protein
MKGLPRLSSGRRFTAITCIPSDRKTFGGHSEPRCGNVPLTRTPNTTPEDAPRESRSAPTRSRDMLPGISAVGA